MRSESCGAQISIGENGFSRTQQSRARRWVGSQFPPAPPELLSTSTSTQIYVQRILQPETYLNISLLSSIRRGQLQRIHGFGFEKVGCEGHHASCSRQAPKGSLRRPSCRGSSRLAHAISSRRMVLGVSCYAISCNPTRPMKMAMKMEPLVPSVVSQNIVCTAQGRLQSYCGE